jgi:hypothetical protein
MNLSWAGPTCENTNSVIITPMLDLLEGIKRKSTQKPFSMLKKKQETCRRASQNWFPSSNEYAPADPESMLNYRRESRRFV